MVWDDERAIREAVAASFTYSEVLVRLELRPAGGNFKQLRKHVEQYEISTEHFDPKRSVRGRPRTRRSLADVLVERSTYARGHVKRRLFEEGLKERRCELCGQGEEWRGRSMSLILDHINGVGDDNRLDNLRILCPNCNATLETHCGRNAKLVPRPCETCAEQFQPKQDRQRFCSLSCAGRSEHRRGPNHALRRVERPPYEELLAMIEADGYEATGRRFGVSGNAVRKWRMGYEREAAS